MKQQSMKGIKNRIWLVLNIIFTFIYLWWRIFYTIPLEYSIVSSVAGISLLIVEILGVFEAFVHYFNMHKIENHEVPEVPFAMFPDVDVFIATYNESSELLHKTVNGCIHMDYPDKSKVHIYLCDDNRRAEVRKLAKDMGINYLDRENNEDAKAGNLNHAMSVTDSPLLVTFDADMIPKHDFLMRTVPYFVDMEIKNKDKEEKDKIRLGFVQTPQSFYNPDLFQFNFFSEGRIPNEQDYFYKDIQVSRNKSNSVIYGGSNTVLSREALCDIGGFYTEAITEDFATGILLQKKGYVCYATNEVLASGLSPTDLKNLIQQRIRWARGVISTARKMHIVLTPHLSFSQKMNYWASMWYWYAPLKRLIYIMSPILFAAFGYMVIKCTLPEVLLFWLPMYITSNISLKMMSRNIRTTKWTGVYETVLFPFLLFPVILETFGITMKQFKVTQKGEMKNEKGKNLLYMIPFAILSVLSVIGIINCVRMIFASGALDSMVVLFWLISNLFSLIMALFFVSGRQFMRKSERVIATIDCEIEDGYQKILCQTKDFSETGVSVVLEEPSDISPQEEISMKLDTSRYHARLKVKVVHVEQIKKRWKYAFAITDMCGTYQDYMQILYDRVPTMPSNLDLTTGSFDDLRLNVNKRTSDVYYENRRLARIPININVKTEGGLLVNIVDFNYEFLAVNSLAGANVLKLITDNGLKITAVFERTVRGSSLYRVENYEEIHSSKEKRKLLEDWLAIAMESFKQESADNVEKKPTAEKTEFSEMDYL